MIWFTSVKLDNRQNHRQRGPEKNKDALLLQFRGSSVSYDHSWGTNVSSCVKSQQDPVRNELITKTNKATAWPVPVKGALSSLKLQGLQKKSKASLIGPESVLFFHLNFSHVLSRTNANTYGIYMLQVKQIISYLNKQQITEETTLQLHP